MLFMRFGVATFREWPIVFVGVNCGRLRPCRIKIPDARQFVMTLLKKRAGARREGVSRFLDNQLIQERSDA